MRDFTIVVLNRFPELARNLIRSIRLTHENMPNVVVVCDSHREDTGTVQIYSEDEFIFSRNVNRGMSLYDWTDVILVNDDCECVEKDFFFKLAAIADKYKMCGILSPLIDGGVGNQLQQYPPFKMWESIRGPEIIINQTICFPCVFISRDLINSIGGLDESFTGYGFDDDDYCIRAREAGYRTMITSSLRIKHGSGGSDLKRGSNWSVSFARMEDPKSNIEIFFKKYPHLRRS